MIAIATVTTTTKENATTTTEITNVKDAAEVAIAAAIATSKKKVIAAETRIEIATRLLKTLLIDALEVLVLLLPDLKEDLGLEKLRLGCRVL